MNLTKKQYSKPTITEVKFEDKNLVSFFVCSKQVRTELPGDQSCCNQGLGSVANQDEYNPS